jgi:hypothetical protein
LLEEIRACNFVGNLNRILLTLFMCCKLPLGCISAADVDHAARRLDKSSFTNMMAGFFLVDH